MATAHILPLSPLSTGPVKALRPCLSPARDFRPEWPSYEPSQRSPSASSSASSVFTEAADGTWVKRAKCVRWKGEDQLDGCAVEAYFHTYSAAEYDRTSIAPPSEQERSCVLPARGSRCYSDVQDDEDEDDDEDDVAESDDEEGRSFHRVLPRSPFATPEDSESESECDGSEVVDEWSECFARRQLMFARMCAMNGGAPQPQFEGFRSLSTTLAEMLRSVGCDEEGMATPRVSSTPVHDGDETATEGSDGHHEHVTEDMDSEDDEDEDYQPGTSGFGVTSLIQLREERDGSVDSDLVDFLATPSLSSADSDGEHSRLASPRGSAVDFLPNVFKGVSSLTPREVCKEAL